MFHGPTAEDGPWKMLRDYIRRSGWRDGYSEQPDDGRYRRNLCKIFVDSGYHTKQVYAFCGLFQKPGWIIPSRGSPRDGAPPVRWAKRLNEYRSTLATVGTDSLKVLLYGWLKRKEPGPGFIHFPKSDQCDDIYFQELTAERRIRRIVAGREKFRWEKIDPINGKNEALDCFVYAFAADTLAESHHSDLTLRMTGDDAESVLMHDRDRVAKRRGKKARTRS